MEKNTFLEIFQALLQRIRGVGGEKPQIREENMLKLGEDIKSFLKQANSQKENPEEKTLLEEILKSLYEFLLLMLNSNRWEDRFAFLYSLELFLKQDFSKDFAINNKESILSLLEDKEMRVRAHVSKIFGVLSSNKSDFLPFYHWIFPILSEKISIEKDKPQGKFLETYLLVLKTIISNYKDPEIFTENQQISPLLSLIKDLLPHPLKHIRVLSSELLDLLFKTLPIPLIKEQLSDLLPFLENGLADNMTEPRFQGTKTAGTVLLRLKAAGVIEGTELSQRFLPKICFNRLYPAESFSKESLRIWKEMVGMQGKQILGSLIQESMDYYLEESLKSNAEIRETACKGLQELMTKVIVDNEEAKAKLLAKTPVILVNLLRLAIDPYHLVREAAFSAILAVLSSENDIFLQKDHKAIEEVCMKYIGDSFHDSRRNVIEILGFLTEKDESSTKTEVCFRIFEDFERKLKENESSCEMHHHHHEEHKAGMIEEEVHTTHHQHKGDVFDGLVAFFKEVARIYSKTKPEVLEKVFGLILNNQIVFKKETSAYVKENVWKNLSEAAIMAGKFGLKRILNDLLTFVFEMVEGKAQESGQGWRDLLIKIQSIIGPNIMKGRVESLQQGKWVKLFQDTIKI